MRHADELAHQIKQTSQQQSEDYGPFVYGHIASYDPALHRVRCILPAMRDEGGNAILTGWMPLGTSMAGPGIGFQYAPLGGATVQNPTAGELVKISRFDRTTGVGHIDGFMFNQVSSPPFPELAPGGLGIKTHAGSSLVMDQNGNVTVQAGAGGSISLGDVGGTLQKLVTQAMVEFFNTHTHPGNGDPPSQTMGDAQLTTAVQGQ
jgi:hypothetical protein